MQKIKISIVYPADILGEKAGGIETFLKGFIKYSPNDFQIRFVGITSERFRTVLKETTGQFGNRQFLFFPLFHERDENKKRIIPLSLRFFVSLLFHSPRMPGNILLFNRPEPILAYLGKKIPKIGFIHTDAERHLEKKESEVLWACFPGLYFAFISFVFKYLTRVYTVNRNTLAFFKKHFHHMSEKFTFMPTWFDPDIFYPDPGNKITLRKKIMDTGAAVFEDKWMLFVGRFQKVKAPLKIISAFNEYLKTNSRVSLIMIGEGNLRRESGELAEKLQILHKVFFLKNVSQNQLADFYRASDLLVLASHFEGMPRCVLEALGSGIPVVTTPVGEVKQIVINDFSGEVTADFHEDSIVKAIKKICDHPEKYSSNNCITAVSVFTPQKVLKPLYDEIYALHKDKVQPIEK